MYQLTIPTPFPVGPVKVYAALESSGLTLVDCGPNTPEAREALEAGLAALGHSIRDVRRILVSHAHADHYGLAACLAAESGAQVYTHPFNRPMLEAYQGERDQRLAFYNSLLITFGAPGDVIELIHHARQRVGEYASPVQIAGDLNDGDQVILAGREWQVLHTPGHSGGLVCLHDPHSHILLSNDHLLRDISSNPLVEPPPPGRSKRRKSLVEYIEQIQRVAALGISVAWPGHGEPIDGVIELVRQRVELHGRRAGRILESLSESEMNTCQITQRLFPKLDALNFFLALSEAWGHLELLETQGRVRSTRRGDALMWQMGK